MRSRRTSILAGALLFVGGAVAGYFLFRIWPNPFGAWYHTAGSGPGSYKAPLVLSVQASYPGANAQTVAETLAAPIEQQVNGVEHMLSMSSQSANDGSYTLHVTFEPGTDLDVAQVLVQNRVSLAVPLLPDVVRMTGISVRKTSPQPLVLVSLTSPDNRYDALYLSNYATLRVKDELARLPGVADIALFGHRDSRMRIVLDPDKLTSHQLTAMDVVTALREQNIQVAAGAVGQAPEPKGQQLQLAVNAPGPLPQAEQIEGLIVKTTANGATVRLKDVAGVKPGGNESSHVILNGKTAVVLGIHALPNAKPSDVSRAVLDKLAELRGDAPEGLALAVAFDFTANLEEANNPGVSEHLVIDAELPESAGAEQTAKTLERAAEALRKTPGVQDVLALTEHPFSLIRNRPCLVVRLAPKDQREHGREQVAEDLRVALHDQVPEAVFRLSFPSAADGFPVYGFPIEFAVEDRGEHGIAFLRERAESLVEKMNQSGKFADAGVGPGLRRVPVLTLDIDRAKCRTLGVEMNDVLNTVQVHLGTFSVNDFNQFGRACQVDVQVDPGFRARPADILKLQVKNKENQLVPLGAVMAVRDTFGPLVIERHNMYPIARISANLAKGVALAEAKSLCETLAGQEFGGKQWKLIWRPR